MFWSSGRHYISKMVTKMLLYRTIIFPLSSYWLAPSWSQYGIYTTRIFVVNLSNYMFHIRFIVLLVGTIMIAIWHIHDMDLRRESSNYMFHSDLSSYWLAPSWSQYGIYTTWIFVVTLSNYMFRYQIYHPIGWHHHGRNMAYTRQGFSLWLHLTTWSEIILIVVLAGTVMVASWHILPYWSLY